VHVLIAGKTGSGKTALARALVAHFERPCLIFDPLRSPGWPTEYVYAEESRFLAAVAQARSCNVVIDEAPELIGGVRPAHVWLATQARHLGHLVHFLAQRPALLSPTVRGSCSHVLALRMSQTDADLLAEEYVAEDLREASELPLGEYLYARPDGHVTRHRVPGLAIGGSVRPPVRGPLALVRLVR
jgi:DNA helicase HerA-like ATPase